MSGRGDGELNVGVACGQCGGPVYMETCEGNGGPKGHEWAIASECQRCGLRWDIPSGCLDCKTARGVGNEQGAKPQIRPDGGTGV